MIIPCISKGEYHSVRRVFVPNGENVFRFAAAVIMSIVYDYEVAPDHDHFVELFERGNALAMEGLTPETAAIVEAFPFGKWSPFIGFSLRADRHFSPQLARLVSRRCLQTQGRCFQLLCCADDSGTL